MCGRYSRSSETKAVVEAFGVDEVATDPLPAFNIGPGQDIAVIADVWLGSGVEDVLKSSPAHVMACHVVSDLVNSMRNRGPEVVARAG